MALHFFEEMSKFDIMPNEITYTTLIKALFQSFQPEKALKMFETMKKSDVTPNLRTYNVN